MILCLNQTVNQSCQAPSSKYLNTNKINDIDRNHIDEDEETEPKKIPNSTCIQSYSTYEVDGHEPFLIPSGCKCHNVKYLWQNKKIEKPKIMKFINTIKFQKTWNTLGCLC